MNQEIAKLYLNSTNLTTTQGQTGIISADKKTITFFLDMRIVLGETLWSKYEYFKMYFTDPTPTTTGLVFTTIFQDGLNLIQASYMGKPAGSNTAISVNNTSIYARFSNNNGSNYLEKQNNINEFVMIKPNTNNIQLTFTLVDDIASATAQTARPFFMTFVPYEDKIIYKNPYNQLFQNEQVNFTLSTIYLGGRNSSNIRGSVNSLGNVFTFNNVNMRNIIGTMWDKYDKFNLVLLNFGTGPSGISYTQLSSRMFFVMEGLEMINSLAVTSTYRQGVGISPLFRYQTTFSTDANYFDYPSGIIGTFRKPESNNVNLTFSIFSLDPASISLIVPESYMTFSIVGIKE